MSRWTDEELRELVTLWPTHSASQIAKRLHRLRSAIRGKAVRLRQEGLLPPNLPKHFDVNRQSGCGRSRDQRSREFGHSRGDNPATFIAVCAALRSTSGRGCITSWKTRDDGTEKET